MLVGNRGGATISPGGNGFDFTEGGLDFTEDGFETVTVVEDTVVTTVDAVAMDIKGTVGAADTEAGAGVVNAEAAGAATLGQGSKLGLGVKVFKAGAEGRSTGAGVRIAFIGAETPRGG